ncbi:hypothetical protein DPMN_101729 [Dreissena polymorpha]|uniref:Uncharacterized protein n=1 Tax=Dreissena polymorpha TaxID=45954 RepID=A0A9D4RA00_DREPO|nr:hypothetical protein DPMN_101729 [Dreissena polymorpha]
MLLISRKCIQRVQPVHPKQLILFEKHCQLDGGGSDVNVHASGDQAVNVSSEAVMNCDPETDIVAVLIVTLCPSFTMEKGRRKKGNSRVLCRLHGHATVVFDCYEDGPSIKDITHQRRGQTVNPNKSFNN